MLEALDSSLFWPAAKIRKVMPIPKKRLEEQKSRGVIQLFRDLFRGFGPAYLSYRGLELPHQRVLLTLITMMNSTKNPHDPKYHPRYQKLLEENGRRMSKFKTALQFYIESKQEEADFLSFLCMVGS